MKSILPLIPAALLFAATAGYATSTDCPAPAENGSQTGAGSAAVTSPAPPKVTSSDAAQVTTDQILERLLGRRSDDLIRKGVGGSRLLDLQGRFTTVSIIVRQPDGTLRPFCVDNIDAARKLLAGPIQATAPPPASAASPAPLQ